MKEPVELETLLFRSICTLLAIAFGIRMVELIDRNSSLGWEVDVLDRGGAVTSVYKAAPGAVQVEPGRVVVKRPDGSSLYLVGPTRVREYRGHDGKLWRALRERIGSGACV